MIKKRERHGASRTKMYWAWMDMRRRCKCKAHHSFAHYGGRGIKVCKRWDKSFTAFNEDVGEPPSPDHSLDRIDNDSGYSPDNVRWATKVEQMRNMRTNRMLFFGDTERSMIEWSEHFGIPYTVLKARVYAGWSLIRAFCEPPGSYHHDRANVWPEFHDIIDD